MGLLTVTVKMVDIINYTVILILTFQCSGKQNSLKTPPQVYSYQYLCRSTKTKSVPIWPISFIRKLSNLSAFMCINLTPLQQSEKSIFSTFNFQSNPNMFSKTSCWVGSLLFSSKDITFSTISSSVFFSLYILSINIKMIAFCPSCHISVSETYRVHNGPTSYFSHKSTSSLSPFPTLASILMVNLPLTSLRKAETEIVLHHMFT